MKSKQCSKCEQTKPIDEFYKNKAYADGHETWCKSCRREWQSQYNKKNEKHIAQKSREWYVAHKEHKNKQCRERCRERWANDPEYRERKNQQKIDSYHNDPVARKRFDIHDTQLKIIKGRIRSREGYATREEWLQLIKAVDYRCVACGKKKKLTVDHIIPVPDGPSTIDNLQPLCNSCNASKGVKTIDYKTPFLMNNKK